MAQAEIVIVVPPFAGIDRPALGPHLLQACAQRVGIGVDIYYANLDLAAAIGDGLYEAIAYASTTALAGERMFTRTAFGLPAWGRDALAVQRTLEEISGHSGVEISKIRAFEQSLTGWTERLADQLQGLGYRIVGCSTTFEQTAASLAIIQAVKRRDSQIVTLLGGANCDGPMANALLALDLGVDYLFRGESESTFVEFLGQWKTGNRPAERILSGQPCQSLDSLPIPDFSQFFDHLKRLGKDTTNHWLSCETSRGCWWGEKQHCTFCGLNAQGMTMRHKSPERAFAELHHYRQRYGPMAIGMTDNIMPHSYFSSLLPKLRDQLPHSRLFYEVKANLKLAQVQLLVSSGVTVVQPGIESLSTRLLQQMQKGVSGRQNVSLLRHARACELELRWNLLYGFPGDQAADYAEQLDWMPLLHHLEPPQGLFPIMIDRFSPYYFDADRFGIKNVRPIAGYREVFPETACLTDMAYHFEGDFESASRQDARLVERLRQSILEWQRGWAAETRPVLAVVMVSADQFLLFDTRPHCSLNSSQMLDRAQATAALVSLPLKRSNAIHRWAREQKLAIAIDQWHVGLATAEPQLLMTIELENNASQV